MRSAKIWAFKDDTGKFYRVKLDDGTEERIPQFKGLTAQQSLAVLQNALDTKFGERCRVTIMNKLAAIDPDDGLTAAQTDRILAILQRGARAPTEH
jgi:hypothetical protein